MDALTIVITSTFHSLEFETNCKIFYKISILCVCIKIIFDSIISLLVSDSLLSLTQFLDLYEILLASEEELMHFH